MNKYYYLLRDEVYIFQEDELHIKYKPIVVFREDEFNTSYKRSDVY